MNIAKLHDAIRLGRIEWRKHALQRLAERGILQRDVLEVLLSGELIEDYANDQPYPSALFLKFIAGEPLHAVAALDEKEPGAYIITAYRPSLDFFEPDYKTRRTQ